MKTVKKQKSGFMKQWETNISKGFKRYYLHAALRWFLFYILLWTVYFLIRFRIPTQEELLTVALVALLFCAVLPPLQWNYGTKTYQMRLNQYGKKH